MMHTRHGVLLALAGAATTAGVLYLTVGRNSPGGSAAAAEPTVPATPARSSAVDQPLPQFQGRLLELAYQAASALPVRPHVKDRSRAQEAVVAACLELDQPQRARRFSEGIENWRRGSSLADLALYLARHGDEQAARECLELAGRVIEGAPPASDAPDAEELDEDGEPMQEWRLDRVRARIAAAYLWLGDRERAREFGQDLVDSEAGQLATVQAMLSDEQAFDRQMEATDAIIEHGNLDQLRNVLATGAQLFERFYADQPRRAAAEQRIRACSGKVPRDHYVGVLMQLAESALAQGDADGARALVDEARALVTGASWTAELRLPLLARLAGLRHRTGDSAAARAELDAARAEFAHQYAGIFDIYRAGVLRPLAEAYLTLGDRTTALEVYKQAVEEGVQNPNSRPRAEDLAATCTSLAVHGLEPDASLWARLVEVRDELGSPW
jgi:tetratricopeptide (TPR) repeat protein